MSASMRNSARFNEGVVPAAQQVCTSWQVEREIKIQRKDKQMFLARNSSSLEKLSSSSERISPSACFQRSVATRASALNPAGLVGLDRWALRPVTCLPCSRQRASSQLCFKYVPGSPFSRACCQGNCLCLRPLPYSPPRFSSAEIL